MFGVGRDEYGLGFFPIFFLGEQPYRRLKVGGSRSFGHWPLFLSFFL